MEIKTTKKLLPDTQDAEVQQYVIYILGNQMGLLIDADDSIPVPRPTSLTLQCDWHAGSVPVEAAFSDGSIDDQCHAARRTGWGIRLGDDALVLCPFCANDYHRRKKAAPRPTPPSQLDLF